MTSLSVKNVPEPLVEELRARARKNRRSLQGELIAILEESVRPTRMTPDDVYRTVQLLGLQTSDDSTRMIREARDSR